MLELLACDIAVTFVVEGGGSVDVGGVLVAVREILLTMFLIFRGDDQLCSSLFRREDPRLDVSGVASNGEVGLYQDVFISNVSTNVYISLTFVVEAQEFWPLCHLHHKEGT